MSHVPLNWELRMWLDESFFSFTTIGYRSSWMREKHPFLNKKKIYQPHYGLNKRKLIRLKVCFAKKGKKKEKTNVYRSNNRLLSDNSNIPLSLISLVKIKSEKYDWNHILFEKKLLFRIAMATRCSSIALPMLITWIYNTNG